MLEKILLGCYILSLGAMTRNLIRIKYQNDFEEEIKRYREYDLATEQIKVGTDQIDANGNYIVLIKHKANEEDKEPFFTHTMPYANIVDSTRLFKVSPYLLFSFSQL